jgi:hypothetical protein
MNPVHVAGDCEFKLDPARWQFSPLRLQWACWDAMVGPVQHHRLVA